jgi:hypothetical protein
MTLAKEANVIKLFMCSSLQLRTNKLERLPQAKYFQPFVKH